MDSSNDILGERSAIEDLQELYDEKMKPDKPFTFDISKIDWKTKLEELVIDAGMVYNRYNTSNNDII